MWLRVLVSVLTLRVKWSAPRSLKRFSGSERRCQMMTRMERPTATIAFFLPRRRAILRYRSPRNVSVRAAMTAASPRMRARYRFPCPVEPLPLVLPAEDFRPGRELRPRAQVSRGGEASHVQTHLGDDPRRRDRSDAG